MTYTSRFPRITAELEARMDAAIREAAEMIANDAKNRVPVRTGKLRDAIHVDRVEAGEYEVIAGTGEVFYGHIVEHGGAYTPAQPFLIPAFEANRAAIPRMAATRLRNL